MFYNFTSEDIHDVISCFFMVICENTQFLKLYNKIRIAWCLKDVNYIFHA